MTWPISNSDQFTVNKIWFRYNMITYNMILQTTEQWLRWNDDLIREGIPHKIKFILSLLDFQLWSVYCK